MTSRRRSAFLAGSLVVAGLLLWAEAPARAEEDEGRPARDVNVVVTAELDTADVATTGQVQLALRFEPQEAIDRAYAIQLRLMSNRRSVVTLDHAPKPPTTRWKKGTPIRYALPVSLPLGIRANTPLEFFVSFYDADQEKALPPRTGGIRYIEFRRIATLTMPDLGPLEDPAAMDAVLAAAKALEEKGRKRAAWNTLEVGLRRSTQDEPKYRARAALELLGAFEPAPISIVEEQIVADRIRAEKERYLRLISGRCFDRKQYHGALRILEAIGGRLSEDARGAVLGALDDAKRVQRDIIDLKVRIFGSATPEQRAEAEKAIATLKYTKKLLARTETWTKKKAWAAARIALQSLTLNTSDRDLGHAATELLAQVEASWLADTPPAEQEIVDRALNHPAWARTKAAASHKFIYIGPETVVEGIPKDSQRRFDLSYIFLTDLFGRLPNPSGDRVTVYFKELWDFGGGVGGGKTIDIGKADRMRPGTRIDNGLLYHELTHCIDDTSPIFPGWREGLANFGAVYAYEALGQGADSLHSLASNLKAFKEDYLERDIVYWRIQNYGPSAGFFLHFVDTHSKAGRNLHDWKPYRQFFREYRDAPIKDARAPYIGRAAAYYLVRAFGPKAFDDLLTFRFPLVPEDRDAIQREIQAFMTGRGAVRGTAALLEGHPGSPLPRDVLQGEMMQALRSGDDREARRLSKEQLGVIHDWMVIGPFKQKGANPGAFVFPPQYEIDFSKEYPGEANICRWRAPGDTGAIKIDATGYVHIEFNYMEKTATYGLTWLTVPEDTKAFVHVRADDEVTLYLNDGLVENYREQSRSAYSVLDFRGPTVPVPDQIKLAVDLRKGRNKLLVKIHNRAGKAGFILAVARQDGRPVPGLTSDTTAPPTGGTADGGKARKIPWISVLKMNFKSKSFRSKLQASVGKWRVAKGVLAGIDDGKGVRWRKYTVRPGFPKDSPSNLIWIKPKFTDKLDEFRLELDFPRKDGPPKLAITMQGTGGTDGLSGWNLILSPRGKDKIAAQIERYEHMYYQVPPLALVPPKKKDEEADLRLAIVYHDRKLTVKLGDLVLFDEVPITPITTGSRIGFSTWPNKSSIARLELSRNRDQR